MPSSLIGLNHCNNSAIYFGDVEVGKLRMRFEKMKQMSMGCSENRPQESYCS